MFFKLIIIFLFIVIFIYLKKVFRLNSNKKYYKGKKTITFNKSNLNNWMSLTKKERYNISNQESISYLNERKLLLEEIKAEYKRISKSNPEKD